MAQKSSKEKKQKLGANFVFRKKVLQLNNFNENKIEIISFCSLFDITFGSMVS